MTPECDMMTPECNEKAIYIYRYCIGSIYYSTCTLVTFAADTPGDVQQSLTQTGKGDVQRPAVVDRLHVDRSTCRLHGPTRGLRKRFDIAWSASGRRRLTGTFSRPAVAGGHAGSRRAVLVAVR